MKKKLNFTKPIQLWGIILLIGIGASIIVVDIVISYRDFNSRADQMRTDYTARQKQMIKQEVERVVDMIRYEKAQSEILTKTKIKSRVYEAYAIARHIYQENKTAKSEHEIQQMIIDAISPVRFEKGNDYYFISRLDGVAILFPSKPELQGVTLLDVRDTRGQYVTKDMIKIVQQSGEGFYEYQWIKPHAAGNDFKKISFIKRLGLFDWFIGTGLYVDDVEAQIKADLLSTISRIRFEKEGYVFVNRLNGDALVSNGQLFSGEKKLWEVFDKNPEKMKNIFEKEYNAALKPEGDYIYYSHIKLTDPNKESPKVSFIYGIPELQWLVGAGVYLDDVENIIARMHTELNSQTKMKMLYFTLMAAGIVGFFLFLFSRLNHRIKKDFNLFVSFFKRAALSAEPIDRDMVEFEELDRMAENANRMLADRKQGEEEIRKLNAELEQRVAERTAQIEAVNLGLANEITESKQKEEKIKRQNALLEGINWIVREALIVESEEELCSQTLAIAEELTGSRFGFIDELNEAGTLDSMALSNPGWEACRMPHTNAAILLKNIPVRGIYSDAIRKGISVIVNDPASHPDRVGVPKGHPPLTTFLGVPLKQGDNVIGLVGLANKELGYDAGDQQNIEMLTIAFVEALNRIRAEHLIKTLNKELQQSIDEVSHVNKELEAFSYSVSHDLRAPLRAIDGFTEILLREYSPKLDDEGKRICSVITGNAKKMGQLIDELLSLSRLGRADMHFSLIDMKALANEVYLELTTPEMRQRINFRLDDVKKASGDPLLIRQVWMNLIANAVKFTSQTEQPVISITCKEEEDQAVYCVKDNGAGFHMQYAGKLFEVFQRLHSEKEFEGTGVGLAIVQRIVHRHGGKVWAEGEVDKGATFCFSIPK